VNAIEFGSLFQFIRNGMNIRQDKSGAGLPITRIETISDAVIDGSRVGYAGLREADCTDWLLQPGDILFSHINSVEHIGKCAVYEGAPEKLVHGMNLLCLRCDTSKLVPEFAKHLIRSPAFRTRLASFINKAVNQASVSISNLKTITVRIPPLEEQRQIAEVLDRVEVLRTKRDTTLGQLDNLTQAIFLDLFGDPLANPKQWKSVKLEDISISIADGPFGSNLKLSDYVEQGVPVLQGKNITGNEFRWLDVRFISHAKAKTLDRSKVRIGDHLLIKIGSIGYSAVIKDLHGFEFAIIPANLAKITPRRTVIDDAFLHAFLTNNQIAREFTNTASKTAQPALSLSRIKSFPIILPPLGLQQEFARQVDAVGKQKAAHRASLAEMDALFSSLQHHAFRGEL